jgi:hypothetical protein
VGERQLQQIDSAAGISSLMRGGDNIIGCRAWPRDSVLTAVAVVISVMLDTSKHFQPEFTPIKVAEAPEEVAEVAAEVDTLVQPDSALQAAPAPEEEPVEEAASPPPAKEEAPPAAVLTRKQVQKAMDEALVNERDRNEEIVRERLEIQRLRVMRKALEVQLTMLKEEIAKLKKQ